MSLASRLGLALACACNAASGSGPSDTAARADAPDRAETPTAGRATDPPQATRPATPAAAPLTLAFTGDVMFGRFIPDGFSPIEAERHDPFAAIAPLLGAADLTIVNLETPVMAAPPATSAWGTRMRFVATPPRLATLAAAGVDVVSLANNHHYDLRTRGVAETPGHVTAAGMVAIGAATADGPLLRVETVEAGGRRLGLVAVATVRNGDQREGEPRLPYAEPRQLRAAMVPLMMAADLDHDLVIAVVHWGTEYADTPERWQIATAHALVDAGADLVIGHHPHVLQAVERYRGALIAYSLGNFLFDNTTAIPRLTGVLTVTVDDAGCTGARFDPALVHRDPEHHVAPARGGAGRTARDRLRTLSAARPFRTRWRDDGQVLHLDAACPTAAATPTPAPTPTPTPTQ